MFRISVCISIIALLLACFVHSQSIVKDQVNSPDKLDGVYEFVSETTVLTKPSRTSDKRVSPEWAGIWQFQHGYYTRILMKRRRHNFFSGKFEDLDFESFAGPYEIEEDSIQLIQRYAIHPFAIDRSAVMKYRIDGDILTLIERLYPYLEDPREGTITTVLRRLK